MASRNEDGTYKLQTNNVRKIYHTGHKVVISNTKEDELVARKDDTSFLPSIEG